MPESEGGLSYNKNYVSRSRMEQVLAQDDDNDRDKQATQSRKANLRQDMVYARPYKRSHRDDRSGKRNDRDHHIDRDNHGDRRHDRKGDSHHSRGDGHSRWRKRDEKGHDKLDRRGDSALNNRHQSFKTRISVTNDNHVTVCDEIVNDFFEGAALAKFEDVSQRLETLKIGNVRTLLN